MSRCVVLILCVLWCSVSQAKVVLPQGFLVCRNDTNFNKCFVDASNADYDLLKDGYVPAGIDPLQPLQGQQISLSIGNPGIGIFLNMDLVNPVFTFHFDRFTKAKIDLTKGTLDTDLVYINFTARATHQSKGRFFLVNIKGHGNFTAIMYKSHVNLKAQLVETERNGEMYWQLENFVYKLVPERMTVDFENMVPNKEINNAIVNVVNENWKSVLFPLIPNIERSTGQVFRDQINSILSKIPRSQILLGKEK